LRLAQARAACCLFVDPDVILEPGLNGRLHAMLVEQRVKHAYGGCGLMPSGADRIGAQAGKGG